MAAKSNYPSAVQMHLKSAIHLWSWSLGSHLRPGGCIWLHRLLSLRGVINQVVEPTSILVTRGAQRAKTNRLDAVGLLRVLALKVHGRSRRLPIKDRKINCVRVIQGYFGRPAPSSAQNAKLEILIELKTPTVHVTLAKAADQAKSGIG
jgi:hypothetical protein